MTSCATAGIAAKASAHIDPVINDHAAEVRVEKCIDLLIVVQRRRLAVFKSPRIEHLPGID